MALRRLGKTIALTLLAVLVLAGSLAGCRAGQPAGDEARGQTQEPASGNTGGSGQGPGGDTGDGGKTLGEWNGPWNAAGWATGQRFRYAINVADDGQVTTGWYSLSVTDAGEGNLNFQYAGKLVTEFSGAFVAAPGDVDLTSGADLMAAATLMGLLVTPALYFAGNPGSWDEGTTWSYGEGENRIAFAITGRRTYAGITGAVGEWTMAGATSVVCVNPHVPLALYVKITTDERNYLEYILTECEGF